MTLIAVISHDNYYSQFYRPSCKLVQCVYGSQTVIFHFLLESLLPEFDHYLPIYTCSTLQ
jgi:hypothetical protein